MEERASQFDGVIVVTLAYFFLYNGIFIGVQVMEKIRLMKIHTAKGTEWNRNMETSPSWIMADRTVANTLEQMVPFLGTLWMHAFFVDPHETAKLGWVYVVARFFFPIFWSLKGQWNVLVELSTQPSFSVINYFTASLLYQIFTGDQLSEKFKSIPTVVIALIIQILMCLLMITVGKLMHSLLSKGFEAKIYQVPKEGQDKSL